MSVRSFQINIPNSINGEPLDRRSWYKDIIKITLILLGKTRYRNCWSKWMRWCPIISTWRQYWESMTIQRCWARLNKFFNISFWTKNRFIATNNLASWPSKLVKIDSLGPQRTQPESWTTLWTTKASAVLQGNHRLLGEAEQSLLLILLRMTLLGIRSNWSMSQRITLLMVAPYVAPAVNVKWKTRIQRRMTKMHRLQRIGLIMLVTILTREKNKRRWSLRNG